MSRQAYEIQLHAPSVPDLSLNRSERPFLLVHGANLRRATRLLREVQ